MQTETVNELRNIFKRFYEGSENELEILHGIDLRVKRGEFIDPSLYYFSTRPTFEIYDQRLSWLYEKVYVCCATRLPDQVILGYYTVEKD